MMDTNINDPIAVIDTSALLSYLLADEISTPDLVRLFKNVTHNKTKLYAPYILKFEFGNAIHMAVVRKRMSENGAKAVVTMFEQLPIIYKESVLNDVLLLANTHNITFYDASYVELAKRYKCRLWTMDKKLNEVI